ncbi:Glycosyl transferase family 14 [Arabidopsis thaliana x Arabidopsis arenosa]|uniref:Glycosyl transferase family 14 n=1 Tax=Arabidopsis thaliana x Arabidopsis arenosa TaxID=1240361 RepID=A0A8T1Z1C5_9BRAS|nr:Glycosyl transferase family 14 [Arabidopsis thaliana x Arabidopsis arenosa]KAG7551943.1 Glycosyl transferase family 14 [Arabidopsis thaliana x Arabidopsis arenosa]
MQSRVVQLEEGKEIVVTGGRTGLNKAFPFKLLLLLGFFLAFTVVLFFISVSTNKYYGINSVVTSVTSSFVPCHEKRNDLDKLIKPPMVLMHNMSDEELLWRASFMPQRKEYPFNRVPKIAFMFLTMGPLPLAPLWERLLKGHEKHYSVYIHSPESSSAKFAASSVFYRRNIPSQVAEWGRMTMCDAERRLLANALLDISNEWFVLLSESCIPLFNFTTIYTYITKSKHSFMGSFDDPSPYGRGRYHGNMAPEVSIDQWRKGSQWFEVNRELAVSIVKDTLYYPKFKEFCQPACYVDEHYFPTMLTIEKPAALANRSVTWVDWSRGGAHPATFGAQDISEEFFAWVLKGHNCTYNGGYTSMCYLFARKFSPSALEPLIQIAPKILSF